MHQMYAFEVVAVEEDRYGLLQEGDSFLQEGGVHDFADCLVDGTSFLLLIPIRLKTGSREDVVYFLPEKADEIDIFGIPSPEQLLGKFHLEEHSSETGHEEEKDENNLNKSSDIGKDIEHLQGDSLINNSFIGPSEVEGGGAGIGAGHIGVEFPGGNALAYEILVEEDLGIGLYYGLVQFVEILVGGGVGHQEGLPFHEVGVGEVVAGWVDIGVLGE